ncbi:hypothetical protein SLE2022_325920 [Rubroshorea leprosula]
MAAMGLSKHLGLCIDSGLVRPSLIYLCQTASRPNVKSRRTEVAKPMNPSKICFQLLCSSRAGSLVR